MRGLEYDYAECAFATTVCGFSAILFYLFLESTILHAKLINDVDIMWFLYLVARIILASMLSFVFAFWIATSYIPNRAIATIVTFVLSLSLSLAIYYEADMWASGLPLTPPSIALLKSIISWPIFTTMSVSNIVGSVAMIVFHRKLHD